MQLTPRSRKVLKSILIVLGSFLVLVLILLLILKSWLLGIAINKAQTKLKRDFHLELSFKSYQLDGFSELKTQGLLCKTKDNDTLAFLDKVNLNIRLLPLITGTIGLSNVSAENGVIKLQYLKELRRKKHIEPKDSGDKFLRMKRYANLLEDLGDFLPNNLDIRNIVLMYHDTSDDVRLVTEVLSYKDDVVRGRFNAFLNGDIQAWTLTGKFNKDNLTGNLALISGRSGFIKIHKITRKFKSDFAFKELDFDLRKFDNNDEKINIEGNISGKGVQFVNSKVSKDTILINEGGFDYKLNIDTGMIAIDSSSYITINGLKANVGIYAKYKTPKNVKICINMAPIKAQRFLNALPQATFDKIKTMQMDGELKYHLGFYLSVPDYDSVYFNSDLDGQNLTIIDYGEAKLNKLNSSFAYIPFNSNRHITVGYENPNFVGLDTISKFMRDVVINSEDGDFFYNKGFNEEAIANSIRENLRKGSFKKGGSTISMQLVKNVFLSHKKTIDRKLEEALMTWMIENMHITTKKRMFEIYLNIIEWGPDVYGIAEASHFYFNKLPSQLTLQESVFLGMIIPAPKSFRYYFDEKGHLRKVAQGYYNLITSKMVAYKYLNNSQRDTMPFDVKLSGPAQRMLRIKDTTGFDAAKEEMDWNDLLNK